MSLEPRGANVNTHPLNRLLCNVINTMIAIWQFENNITVFDLQRKR